MRILILGLVHFFSFWCCQRSICASVRGRFRESHFYPSRAAGTVLQPDQVVRRNHIAPSGGSSVVPYGRVPDTRREPQDATEPRF